MKSPISSARGHSWTLDRTVTEVLPPTLLPAPAAEPWPCVSLLLAALEFLPVTMTNILSQCLLTTCQHAYWTHCNMLQHAATLLAANEVLPVTMIDRLSECLLTCDVSTHTHCHYNTLQHTAAPYNTHMATQPHTAKTNRLSISLYLQRLNTQKCTLKFLCVVYVCVTGYAWFICVTWLIHMCDMTHSDVWHDSFICVTRQDPFMPHTYARSTTYLLCTYV